MPFRAATLAILAIVTLDSSAQAQSAAWVQRWEVPAGCPTGPWVEAELARLLGESAGTHAVRLEGIIEPSEAGLTLRLTVAEAGEVIGERLLSGSDCAALAEAAALLAALAVDPGAVAAASASGQPPALPADVVVEGGGGLDAPLATRDAGAAPDAPLATRDAGTAPGQEAGRGPPGEVLEARVAAPSESPPTSAAAARWPLAWALDGRVGLELGTLPAVAAVLRLGVAFARRRLRASWVAQAVFPRSEVVPRREDTAEARFFALGARLELGGGTRFARLFRFQGGAVVSVDALSGSSAGVTDPSRGSAALVAVGAVARLLVDRGRVRLGIEGDLRVILDRALYAIVGLDWSYQPPRLVGQVSLVVRFGASPGGAARTPR